MRLEFHPFARSDVSRIMDYYEAAGGPEIADERFPFHFLYRIVGERVRILAVRHHRRRPSLGTHRR
jgi:plasmid stabilization system protein ParE